MSSADRSSRLVDTRAFRASAKAGGYDIVVFLVDKPGAPPPPAGMPDGVEMTNMLWRSARMVHGDTGLYVLTSPDTDLTRLDPGFVRVDRDVDPDRLMFERTVAQKAFADTHHLDRPLAFLDSDMLIQRSLQPLFKRRFDIGLTIRKHRSMPINGGAIFVNNRDRVAVRRFFNSFEKIYRSNFATQADWWGDQHALALMFGDTQAKPNIYKFDSVRIAFLPEFFWNNPIPKSGDIVPKQMNRSIVIHFKGLRKLRMTEYFRLISSININLYLYATAYVIYYHFLTRLIDFLRESR